MNTRLFILAMSGLLVATPLAAVLDSKNPPAAPAQTTKDLIKADKEKADLNPSAKAALPTKMKGDHHIKLHREITQAIMADKELSPIMSKVTIRESKGVVTLTGKAKSADIKSKIENKIKHLPGVVKVANNLEIEK
jgi:hypothetical protein